MGGEMKLAEADLALTELEDLIRRINRTNAATRLGVQRTNREVDLLGGTVHHHVLVPEDDEGGQGVFPRGYSGLVRSQLRTAARSITVVGTAIGVLVTAFVVIVVWWFAGLVLVLGGWVLPGWALGGGLLVLSVTLWRYGVAIRLPEAKIRRVLPRWSVAWLAVLTGLCALLGALGDVFADYRVLRPPGPDGCQAVVRESAVVLAGRGEVYAVEFAGIGLRRGSWFADDGGRPVAQGDYELTWGDSGILRVWGTEGNPVYPALHDLECS
ncbi:hypothetical protein M8C13_03075 [Crossiella sp. SN42]|uniref:hypothetical protein n=1 Tax=Crossiella sp. SN42 TaxID=2944808 RepID=UPI00207CB037|nr:hypothetical protein [Crossiella sp. SN42]MCO1574740.1 hypothetical protein [Crossiella sp. SN42]